MSATERQPQPKITIPNENIVHVKPRLPYYQLNPSYTLRVICCVLFIFLTEICLTHYIYRLINTEIRDEYLLKKDFEQSFINALRSGPGRDEFLRIFKELDRYSKDVGVKNSSGSATVRTKRDAYVLDDDNVWNVASDGPNMDLFNLRDLENSKGDADKLKTGKKGEVWLTSHNRISLDNDGKLTEKFFDEAKSILKDRVNYTSPQIDTILSDCKEKPQYNTERKQCNDYPFQYMYCIWHEAQLVCPVEKQIDPNQCKKLKDYLSNIRFQQPNPEKIWSRYINVN